MIPEDYSELRLLARLLSERRTTELSQCAGKQSFDERVTANRAARSLGNVVDIYRCPMCGKWHVGSNVERNKNMRLKRIIKRQREAY